MTTKYDAILLSKLITPTSFNLLEKYPKTHPVLQLLTYDHFIPLFAKQINEKTDYYSFVTRELENKTYMPNFQNETIHEKIQSLGQKLKTYYCCKHFSLNHFIFYLCDIAKTAYHLSQIPDAQVKTSDEVLNEIERRVLLVKSLDYYQTKSFIDRIQMTLLSLERRNAENEDKSNSLFKSIYETKVIDKEVYDKLNYRNMLQKLGTVGKERRCLGYEYGNYNYIPIICKQYCLKQSDEMIKSINAFCNKCSCEICKRVLDKISEINDEIRVLYMKTCCFSHNEIEYDYHPLIYHTYRCECKDISSCSRIHDDNVKILFNPIKIKDIRLEINKMLQEIVLDNNSCFKREMNTTKCYLLQGTQYHDLLLCKDYHCSLERRRVNKVCYNLPCKYSINNKKWVDYLECPKKDDCPFYHTRNELFFDKRNYRKIYDCCRADYCDYGEMCPHKHPYDIDIDEIYLPTQEKKDIIKQVEEVKQQEKIINFMKSQLKTYQCYLCLRYDKDVIYLNDHCKHFLCENCKKLMQICPCYSKIDKNKSTDEEEKSLRFIKFELKSNNREQETSQDYSFEKEEKEYNLINRDNVSLTSEEINNSLF